MRVPLILALCLGVIAAGAASWWVLYEPPPAVSRVWFYDLNTKTLFPASSSARPPIEAPSGFLEGAPAGTLAGVRAMAVQDGDRPRVVLLITHDEDQTDARLVRRPGDREWVHEMSPAGRALLDAVEQDMAGKTISVPP